MDQAEDECHTALEAAIRELTRPIAGQYPRPWITEATQPCNARVFVMGRNQHNGYDTADFKDHKEFVDNLFNRPPGSCRATYARIVGVPSPTRRNMDRLVAGLAGLGIGDIVQTNVVCFSTPMSADLAALRVGAERGREIFECLLKLIRPKVVIAHGSGTAKDLRRVLPALLSEPSFTLPAPPHQPEPTVRANVGGTTFFLIPSLAPPAYYRATPWIWEHIGKVCEEVRDVLNEVE